MTTQESWSATKSKLIDASKLEPRVRRGGLSTEGANSSAIGELFIGAVPEISARAALVSCAEIFLKERERDDRMYL